MERQTELAISEMRLDMRDLKLSIMELQNSINELKGIFNAVQANAFGNDAQYSPQSAASKPPLLENKILDSNKAMGKPKNDISVLQDSIREIKSTLCDLKPLKNSNNRHSQLHDGECSTLFVRGFNNHATKFDLLETFSACGKIRSIDMVLNSLTRNPYAFIHFESKQSVENALLSNLEVKGCKLVCQTRRKLRSSQMSTQIESINEFYTEIDNY